MADSDDIRKMQVGGVQTVDLPSSGTSGYQWQASAPASVKVERSIIPPADGAIGGGASERFAISPSRRGEQVVTFKLKRPWENRAIEQRRVKLVTS